MKQKRSTLQNEESYNETVKKAYFRILNQAKRLIATLEQDELRYTLERRDSKRSSVGAIVHELISPMLYLRLEWHTDNVMAIHFGIEQVNQFGQLSDITTQFLRLLYNHTSRPMTDVYIENCVRTDWFINSCSAMYEYVETRNKHHVFKQIRYKATTSKQKTLLSVV